MPTSAMGSTILLLASGIGTGVLVLPRTMAAVGYVPMLGLLFFGSCLSAFTTWMLFLAVAKTMRENQPGGQALLSQEPSRMDMSEPSYSDLLCSVTNSGGAALLDVILVIYTLGTLTTYFLFVADFMQALTFWPDFLGTHATIIIIGCIVLPSSIFQSVGTLSKLASAGLVSLLLMSVAIFIRMPSIVESHAPYLVAVADIQRTPTAMCIAVYAFMWHTNCVGIARELQNPTPARCAMVSIAAPLLLALVYASIAMGGYYSWGEELLEFKSIVSMYDKSDNLFVLVRLALILGILVASGLNLYPVRESCVSLVRNRLPAEKLSHRIIWSLILVGFVVALSILFPDVVQIITVLGGTFCSLLMILFPAMISRLVFGRAAWIVVLCLSVSIFAALIASALGFIGRPV